MERLKSSLILFEDDNCIVINKPSGLLSIPDREGKEVSLKKMLQEKYGSIYTIHRLDRDTSGVIIFAKNDIAHKELSAQFENRLTKKIYHGLTINSLRPKQGVINKPIAEHAFKRGIMTVHKNGKESITEFTLLEDFTVYSYVEFNILTGRTHQIRVHMKDMGYPIACDVLYGDGKPILVSALKSKFKLSRNVLEERPILGRLALHAYQLTITIAGEEKEFTAPLHKDMQATLQQLRKHKL